MAMVLCVDTARKISSIFMHRFFQRKKTPLDEQIQQKTTSIEQVITQLISIHATKSVKQQNSPQILTYCPNPGKNGVLHYREQPGNRLKLLSKAGTSKQTMIFPIKRKQFVTNQTHVGAASVCEVQFTTDEENGREKFLSYTLKSAEPWDFPSHLAFEKLSDQSHLNGGECRRVRLQMYRFPHFCAY